MGVREQFRMTWKLLDFTWNFRATLYEERDSRVCSSNYV
jgi:hypothetical protein